MNMPSASRAEPGASAPRRILVWDAPVRVFHWLLVACFAGAYATAESETWRLVHVTLGYTFGGLLAFRLVWGLIGPRHARFASFVRGPAAVLRYVRGLAGGRPEHHVGHNPAGALAIVAILALGAALVATGLLSYQELAGDAAGELHEFLGNALLALAGVHVAAVLLSSRVHHENLVGAMLTGRKIGPPAEAIRHAWRSVAALMVVAVMTFWWLQWQQAPAGGPDRPAAHAKQDLRQGHDGDGD